MRSSFIIFVGILFALASFLGCQQVNQTPIGKGVKTYEKYSDDLGKKRDVKFMGKDVIVEPEAAKKIRINF